MANVHISDHILYNILARLHAKPLLRFKCVSKHWNRLIKDPYLTELRSRRMILLSHKSLVAIDDNVHVDDTTNSIVEVGSFLGPVTIVGTFDGILLLVLIKHMRHQLVLYNPFTRVSKTYPPSLTWHACLKYKFGFGLGATMDDLKFVRFFYIDHENFNCDVFSFKNRSWEKIELSNAIRDIKFLYGDVGTIDGCLCMIDKCGDMGFNVWVMKRQGVENSWTKRWSFTLRVDSNYSTKLFPVCILDSGKILIMDRSHQLFIYCTSNDSSKKLNRREEVKGLYASCNKKDGIECVESLVSPLDLCFV
ncbi:F-box domain-containing protein [Artemisia annua]|uniref:F-box domain-containing protein n=1 Tax=Artemisia annua TaxID=35608 RepID=A0A2U1NWI8_ARTAN|nr:F-box domain-containing protein [Artemisia annua]